MSFATPAELEYRTRVRYLGVHCQDLRLERADGTDFASSSEAVQKRREPAQPALGRCDGRKAITGRITA